MNINNPGLLTTWFTMLSFTFQIYFYCSGYCDMAAGIGKMFGLSIPFNFLSPYKATSLSEFTNRWHTSLTGIIRDLIYTPLTSKRKNIVISCIAIITSIIIGSFWFGNSLNVLICGFLYGCLLCLETLFGKLIRHIPKRIRGGLTFLTINLLFILLSTESISKAVQRYKGLINFNNLGIDEISRLTAEGSLYFPNLINIVYFLVYFLLGIGICFFGKNTKEMMKSVSFTTISAMGLGLLLLIIVIHMTRLEFLF